MPETEISPSIVKECIRVYATELQKPHQGSMPEHQAAAFRQALEAFDQLREVRVAVVVQGSDSDSVSYLRAKLYDPLALLTTGLTMHEVADKYEVSYATVTSWVHRAKIEIGARTTFELLVAIQTGRVRRQGG